MAHRDATTDRIMGIYPFHDEYHNMWYTEYMRQVDYDTYVGRGNPSSSGRRGRANPFRRLIVQQVQLLSKRDFDAQRNHPNALPWFTVTPYQPQD